MQYTEILPQLCDRFPELAESYEALRQEWSPDEPGVYNVTDTVWQELVAAELEAGDNSELLRRVFEFVEDLCKSDDEQARFVGAELSWGQLGATPLLERARPFLGPVTRELVAKCEAEWLEAREKRDSKWWRRITRR